MRLLSTFMLALLMAGAAHAQATKAADKPTKVAEKADKSSKVDRGETPDRASDDDEALAMAAVEGLMAQPPQRALPILKKVLAGSQPTVVKRRALFVLAQINAPEAHELLMQT